MCPHTLPISKAGSAAAKAAGRLLRAFEAELSPVLEAIAVTGNAPSRWDAAARARAAAVVERARAKGIEISKFTSGSRTSTMCVSSIRTSWWSAEEHRWGPPEPGSSDDNNNNSSSSSSSTGGGGGGVSAAA